MSSTVQKKMGRPQGVSNRMSKSESDSPLYKRWIWPFVEGGYTRTAISRESGVHIKTIEVLRYAGKCGPDVRDKLREAAERMGVKVADWSL